MLLYFWSRDILLPLGIASCFGIFLLLDYSLNRNAKILFYCCATLGMCGAAWLPRLKAGGYENNLMPAHAMIALLFGVAFHEILTMLHRLPSEKKYQYQLYIYLICLVQFVVLFYNPLQQIPTKEDRQAGQYFLELVAAIDGPVLFPGHGYLLTLAGEQSTAHEMAVHDNLTGGTEEVKNLLQQNIREAIAERRFKAIILDHGWWFSAEVDAHYQQQVAPILTDNKVFWPVTGFQTRPEIIYVPRDQ